jgi:transposase-like protein
MGEQQRKRYTSEEKVAILKEHLTGRKPVSEVCERHGIAVNMFYRWQEEFFAKAAGVFDGPRPKPAQESKLEKRVADLESRLTRKHEVLSELMEEHVALKKKLGEI